MSVSGTDQAAARAGPVEESRQGGALPNVIVIGAMKCGTSAVHYCLDVHPEAAMSNPKEMNFFIDQLEDAPDVRIVDPRERDLIQLRSGNWSRGLDWYRSHFDPAAKVRGESSPAYTAPWTPGAAERIAATIPDARLIYMVRDPIVRMLSEFQHQQLRGLEWRNPDDALSRLDGTYISRSRYWARLEPFATRFDREQILVVSQEALFADRRGTLQGVFRFLGIDDTIWSEKMSRLWNTTGGKDWRRRYLERARRLPGLGWTYNIPREWKWRLRRLAYRGETGAPRRPEISGATQAAIEAELASDLARLREWSGMSFEEWSS